jgi:predicted transcriptional regulator
MSHSEKIPISTAYRRVNELKDTGLLTVEKTILTDEGKKFELFRSSFRGIHMEMSQGGIISGC